MFFGIKGKTATIGSVPASRERVEQRALRVKDALTRKQSSGKRKLLQAELKRILEDLGARDELIEKLTED